LSDLSFLEKAGFIAGVTNPVFETHYEWYDLLILLNLNDQSAVVMTSGEKAKEMSRKSSKPMNVIPSSYNSPSEKETDEQKKADRIFATKILSGIRTGLSEEWVRASFMQLTMALFDVIIEVELEVKSTNKLASSSSSSIEPNISGHMWKKMINEHGARISGFTSSVNATSLELHRNPFLKHKAFDSTSPSPLPPLLAAEEEEGEQEEAGSKEDITTDESVDIKSKTTKKGYDELSELRSKIRRIVHGAIIHEVDDIYALFYDIVKFFQSEISCQILLTLLPDCLGGLNLVFGPALFHDHFQIRQCSFMMLNRLESYPSTSQAVQILSPLFREEYESMKLDEFTAESINEAVLSPPRKSKFADWTVVNKQQR
jgi:hypothetical protein